MIKRQFGFVKIRYRGLKKNTAQIVTLFALSNLWMVRTKLMGPSKRRDFWSVCVKLHHLKINDLLLHVAVSYSEHP
jgi:hypothetical protein